MVKKAASRIYIGFIFLLLYAPIATLMLLSFNDSRTRAQWGGFTLKWYVKLFQDQGIMSALFTTLVIALLASLVASLLGTAAALGINAMGRRLRSAVMGLTNIPLLNADIVTAIALMLLFMRFVNLGFTTVVIGHITFCLPFVILSVLPKLAQLNPNIYEAALDLGASRKYAFYRVILPDIFPGVMTGFMLSFTMSMDDFIITHFTKGVGVDTLSTKIYTEVRKGIRPEIYAVSTLLFLVVLICLFLYNRQTAIQVKKQRIAAERPVEYDSDASSSFLTLSDPQKDVDPEAELRARRRAKGWKIAVGSAAGLLFAVLLVYSGMQGRSANEIYVYNWGEYMDPQIITQFEQETGIKVRYEEYSTNEEMYPKVKSGAATYDVVFPSDYMVQKMIDEDMLAKLDYSKIPNIKNIGASYMKSAQKFDPGNQYAIPYIWGTVGILYNKKMVHEPVHSWSILWDPKYKGEIYMQNSVRDAFSIPLLMEGHSLNSTNKQELEQAKDLLIKQKPLVQAYLVDEVRDKMIGNEGALGVIYSGEAIFCHDENPDLEYVVPDEGSNIWIDCAVIPKNAKNKEGAEEFLNFLCRPEVGVMNFNYITYSTPNVASQKLLPKDIQDNQIAFPDQSILDRCEPFQYLGPKMEAYYDQLWKEVKSY